MNVSETINLLWSHKRGTPQRRMRPNMGTRDGAQAGRHSWNSSLTFQAGKAKKQQLFQGTEGHENTFYERKNCAETSSFAVSTETSGIGALRGFLVIGKAISARK